MSRCYDCSLRTQFVTPPPSLGSFCSYLTYRGTAVSTVKLGLIHAGTNQPKPSTVDPHWFQSKIVEHLLIFTTEINWNFQGLDPKVVSPQEQHLGGIQWASVGCNRPDNSIPLVEGTVLTVTVQWVLQNVALRNQETLRNRMRSHWGGLQRWCGISKNGSPFNSGRQFLDATHSHLPNHANSLRNKLQIHIPAIPLPFPLTGILSMLCRESKKDS